MKKRRKESAKPLTLHKETLRRLGEMEKVAGGYCSVLAVTSCVATGLNCCQFD